MGEFSEKEREALRKLVPLADEIAQDAKYQQARNIVWKHWKGLMISLAAFVVAVAVLWEKFRALGTWLSR